MKYIILLLYLSFAYCQLPFGNPFLGLSFNPYTSAIYGYGLGPQHNSLYSSLAANYLYGSMSPYLGYPGTYGLYGIGTNSWNWGRWNWDLSEEK